jgi:putative Mg2+ transporter-C (MgtC) family protein
MLTQLELLMLGRVALAALLGLAIGWERRAAGSSIKARTVALTALTAAVLTALGLELFVTGTDRIVQGLVTGIGFIGAGVIIHGADGEIRGLTTAASMWAVTGVGIAVGSGHALFGVLLALLIYLLVAWGQWPALTRWRQRGQA